MEFPRSLAVVMPPPASGQECAPRSTAARETSSSSKDNGKPDALEGPRPMDSSDPTTGPVDTQQVRSPDWSAIGLVGGAVLLTLAPPDIHPTLGGVLFTLNALGYATLAIARSEEHTSE